MMGSLGLSSAGSPFQLATWNAHSICNKRPEIESLIYTHDLDILGVTESWLRPGDAWELPGFMSYRFDRTEGQGGGVLVLVRREYRVSRFVTVPGRPGVMGSVGVVLFTNRGSVATMSVYAPPGPGLEGEVWSTLLERMRPYSAIFLCGDFNAHHVSWGCSCSSPRGTALFEASLACDPVSVNDSRPTYVPDAGSTPSNIDLIFCPLSFAHLANVEVISDPYESLRSGVRPSVVYDEFMRLVLEILLEQRARRRGRGPSLSGGPRSAMPKLGS